MGNITMIAAIGKNGELGKKNTLIWHFKEDMQFFKEQTMGKPVAMGINTLRSLPKLLPGINIIYGLDGQSEKTLDYNLNNFKRILEFIKRLIVLKDNLIIWLLTKSIK